MPKFKVGDQVKLVSKKPKWLFGPYVNTGDIGSVWSVTPTDIVELHVDFPKHKGWSGMESEFVLASKSTTTTQKPKEPKTMQTTKKPGTTHGKPTAKGMKVEKKPATAKPKYPAARVQRELIAEAKPLEKRTKAELIETAQDLAVQFHNLAADHCIAGTKLDRALVDLKEAKAKIKELAKGTEAAK